MLSSYCRPASRPPQLSDGDFGQEIDDHPLTPTEMPAADPVLEEEETPAEVAMLLTSIRDISNKEIKDDPPIITELADAFLCFPDLNCGVADDEPIQEGHPLKRPTDSMQMLMQHDRKKTRSISMDSPEIHSVNDEDSTPLLQWRNIRGESTSPPHGYSIHSTPPPSPRKRSSRRIHLMPKSNRPRAVSCAEAKDHALLEGTKTESGSNKKLKLIRRAKFSWKNYPKLEEFLIANREEYLRHSTLNYTMQQKKYNNTLTQRLIELAATHGYQFDPQDFSFVTVRDRIRCYFKSYVQSMKKRGVVIGYAARKAGLVTEEELEASAMTSGKIYVPNHEMEWERDDV